MYEGKNIHYSPVDNKPLCSFSGKLCKQRRLNGYALCLRHVLEDPGAPFRQCTYMARNKQQCTNPIHQSNTSQYCTSHMQLVGLLPVSSKAASKAMKNGHHNHHTADGSKSKLPPKSATTGLDGLHSAVSLSAADKRLGDSYTISDAEKRTATSCISRTLNSLTATTASRMGSIPMARLYPELAEKLDAGETHSMARKLDVRFPLLGTIGAPNAAVQIASILPKESNRQRSRIAPPNLGICTRPVTLNHSVGIPAALSSLNQTAVISSSVPTFTLPPKTTIGAGTVPVIGFSWPSSTSISRLPSTTVPSPQLFSQALRGLLGTSTSTIASPAQQQQQQTILRSLFPGIFPCPASSSGSASTATTTSCNSDVNAAAGAALLRTLQEQLILNINRASAAAVAPTPPMTSVTRPAAPAATVSVSSTAVLPPPCFKTTTLPVPPPDTVCYVQPKRPRVTAADREIRRKLSRNKSALKVYSDYMEQKASDTNILPFGIDSSDEDSSDLDYELPRQRFWSSLSSDDEDCNADLAPDVAANIRRTKLQLIKSRERRRFLQLQQRHEGNKQLHRRRTASILNLIDAARRDAASAAEALEAIHRHRTSNYPAYPQPRPQHKTPLHRTNDVHLRRRQCLHKTEDDVKCSETALPYTNHCIKHIMYNVDQQLFSYCTAKSADGTQCCVPVFDATHELPLCTDHSAEAEIRRITECSEPKPKKPRKRTKPSALTRHTKKSKKKKKKVVNQLIPLVVCSETAEELSGHGPASDTPSSMVHRPMVFDEPLAGMTAITSCSSPNSLMATAALSTEAAMPKDSLEDDGLDLVEPFSPGTIASSLGLPLDTDQATKFLDDHDLHDVLNKMPDEAFDLLTGTGKNGDYGMSKDEDDVLLARVFAEASKQQFAGDMKDDSLSMLEGSQSRTDAASAGSLPLNDDELMKQLNVFLNRNPMSPSSDDFGDGLGDFGGGLTASDLRNISQVLAGASSSSWTANLPGGSDCDNLTFGADDTPKTSASNGIGTSTSAVEVQSSSNGIVVMNGFAANHHPAPPPYTSVLPSLRCPTTTVVATSAPVVSAATLRTLRAQVVNAPVAFPTTSQNLATSLRTFIPITPQFLNGIRQQQQRTVPSTASFITGTTPVLTTPILHIGSLPGLQQLFAANPGNILISTSPAVSGATRMPSQLQTLPVPDVQALMKQSWRYVIDPRLALSSAPNLTSIPIARFFSPFTTTPFCPPPAPTLASSSAAKMEHPLASAVASSSHLPTSVFASSFPTLAAVSLSSAPAISVGSILPAASLLQFTAAINAPTVFLSPTGGGSTCPIVTEQQASAASSDL